MKTEMIVFCEEHGAFEDVKEDHRPLVIGSMHMLVHWGLPNDNLKGDGSLYFLL